MTLYLNDAEAELIEATNNYLGGEKAPLLRDLLIQSAHRVLAGEANLQASSSSYEDPQSVLFKS